AAVPDANDPGPVSVVPALLRLKAARGSPRHIPADPVVPVAGLATEQRAAAADVAARAQEGLLGVGKGRAPGHARSLVLRGSLLGGLLGRGRALLLGSSLRTAAGRRFLWRRLDRCRRRFRRALVGHQLTALRWARSTR